MSSHVPEEIECLVDHWGLQRDLPEVIRWGSYVKDGQAKDEQCLGQHKWSLQLLCEYFVTRMEEFVNLDERLLLYTTHVHDIGEALTGRDVQNPDKVHQHEVKEYKAFYQEVSTRFVGKFFEKYHRAFLLQFVYKEPDGLPEQAQEIVENLSRSNYNEAVAFAFLEVFDYLLYAISQYQRHGSEEIMLDILRNNIPRLDEISQKLEGIQQTLWTPEIQYDLRQLKEELKS